MSEKEDEESSETSDHLSIVFWNWKSDTKYVISFPPLGSEHFQTIRHSFSNQ